MTRKVPNLRKIRRKVAQLGGIELFYLRGILGKIATCVFAATITLGIFHSAHAATCAAGEIDVLGDGTQCEPAKFTLTTTTDATSLVFTMSATGEFYVDCGDGGTLSQDTSSYGTVSGNVITRTGTDITTYTCTWNTAGAHAIRFAGAATGYSTSDTTAAISFYISWGETQTKVAAIDGSLGAIFGTIGTGANNGEQPRFYQTFYNCSNLSGAIPGNLFAGISDAPTAAMFASTFNGCSNLSGAIPENLFAGISGAPAERMFWGTFFDCSNLSGAIPANLFSGIRGAPAENMFDGTFSGCSGLTGPIPENLFAGIRGAPADAMFGFTFAGCSGLTGTIPENLFAGISGAPAGEMFVGTFGDCSGLSGSIPENLFSGIRGAPAEHMFESMFSGCSGLSEAIPENLFAGISGAPAELMFYSTFSGCSGLTGPIPENLFSGISGAPAEAMFYSTFSDCSGLTGSIPENLFADISGAPAEEMFYGTFLGCSGLSGMVPKNLFAGISTATTAMDQMGDVFADTGLATQCPVGMTQYTTGFESYFGDKVACDNCAAGTYKDSVGNNACTACPDNTISTGTACELAKFTLTTTTDATSLVFTMTAKGTFYVDCGDGGRLTQSDTTTGSTISVNTITRTGTDYTTYTCTWDTAGAHAIRFAGAATGYSTSNTAAAISFYKQSGGTQNNVAAISGSLGAIFGTIGTGYADNQSRFYYTFANCSNLTGSIPENLFAGIRDVPTNNMFESTFSGCSGLSGSIPENLFSGIRGTPVDNMFESTFSGCSGLSGSIPENLFARISGRPANYMFSGTFSGCSNLSGPIPENLFARISGAPAYGMFFETFNGCNNLSGTVPKNLFAGISTATTASDQMTNVFENTGLATQCPVGMTQYTTGFESDFGGKVACENCADGTYKDFVGNNACIACPVNTISTGTTCEPTKFTLTTTSGVTSLVFTMSATGTFYVDCGDGGRLTQTANAIGSTISRNTITRTSAYYNTTYECKWDTAGTHTLRFGGAATGYSTSETTAAISFYKQSGGTQNSVANISGSLGAIFGTIGTGANNGEQPRFYYTFFDCSNLTGSIPENLFTGISGAPASYMFAYTFNGCSGLSGSIPENLFAGISGAPADSMFTYTFYNCSGLSGSIPENLFAGIRGAPADNMFYYTFYYCSRLTGEVPKNLFAGISTATTANNQMNFVFSGTGMTTQCPAGTTQYTTGFESYFDGRVACENCAAGTYKSTTGNGACTACNTVAFNKACSIPNGTGNQTCYRETGHTVGAKSATQCTGEQNCTACTLSSCDDGYTAYSNACHAPCANMSTLHVGEYEYRVFGDKTNVSAPVLHLMKDNNMCYVYLGADTGDNGIKLQHDNNTYKALFRTNVCEIGAACTNSCSYDDITCDCYNGVYTNCYNPDDIIMG